MPILKKSLELWKIVDGIYDVEVVNGLTDDKGIPQKGYCNSDDRIIQIDRPIAKSETTDSIKTILHEVTHPIIDALYHGRENFDKNEKQIEKLEKTVEFITSCAVMLMIDNTEQFQEFLNLIKRRKARWQKRRIKKRR